MDKEKEKQTPDGTNENDYRDEMEELKNIFKNELKKAMDEAENPESEIVKEKVIDDESFSQYEVEGYDPKAVSFEKKEKAYKQEELCECCGERPRGTRRNPDSPYCEDCEVLLEKYPYDWRGIVALIVIIGIALGSLVMFTQRVPVFAKMKMGDSAMAKNKIYTAMTKYEEAQGYVDDLKLTDIYGLSAKKVDALYRLVNMSGMAQEIDSNINKKVLKMLPLKSTREKSEEIIKMFGTVEAIEKILNKYETVKYDAIIADLDKLSGTKIYYVKDKYYFEVDKDYTPNGTEKVYVCDEGWINLYKYSAAQASEKDKTVLLGFLEKANEAGSEYLKNLVSPLLAATYVGTGNYEKAEALAEDFKDNNVEAPDYYMIKAMLMRYRDNDPETAIKFCDNGLKQLSELPNGEEMAQNKGYSLSLQKAINLCLQAEGLNGDARKAKLMEALDCAGDAHVGSGTVQARDFYAIVSLAVENKEVYEALEKEIKEYGEEAIQFTDDVVKFKEGKITLKEIVMSGRYDLQ